MKNEREQWIEPKNKYPEAGRIINLIKKIKEGKPRHDYFLRKETGHWNVKFTTPFSHYWTFGMNIDVPIRNLTTPDEPLLLFTSGNFPILYNYEYETMVTLKGHRNKIRTTTSDGTGQWIATADNGPGNTVIIWNVEECTPVYTLFEFEDKAGPKAIYLSDCGKYLVILLQGVKKQEILLYEWASTNNYSKATLVLDPNFGEIVAVDFCHEISEYLMVTSKTHVIFLTYNLEIQSLIYHNPTFNDQEKVGIFTASTYLTGTHLSITGTSTGYMIIWSDLDYFEGPEKFEMRNEKDLITSINLIKDKINALHSIDGFICVGTQNGKISFFDKTLRIMHWFQHDELDSVIQISFHRKPREETRINPNYSRRKVNTMFILGKLCVKEKRHVVDWGEIGNKLDDEDEEFSVRDCLMRTATGNVAYVNFTRHQIEYILDYFVNNVTAMDVHPATSYLCVGTNDGKACLIDFKHNQALLAKQKIRIRDKPAKKMPKVKVTCMKYNGTATALACGLSNGEVHLIHPLLLTPMYPKPFYDDSSPITHIRFSTNSMILAYCNKNATVYMVKLEMDGTPIIIGKCLAHSAEITDMLFTEIQYMPTLFSIGKDKYIVAFDVKKSVEKKSLIIEKRVRVEQRSIPLCLADDPAEADNLILANSALKFRIMDGIDLLYITTKQAPLLDNPLSKIEILNDISQNEYMIFSAGNEMGIIKFPLDGNPFKWISYHMGEGPIIDFVIDKESTFLFSLSKGDKNVQMWRIMPGIVDVLERQGGTGITPFLKLLGPDEKSVLNELRDYFHYAHILHQGDCPIEERARSNSLSICEVPDVLRAIGCFPTVFDLDCLTDDSCLAKVFHDSHISFEEFVQLYVNYKDAREITEQELKTAFQTLLEMKNEKHPTKKGLSREDFINVLVEWGEPLSYCEAFNFLKILIKPSLVSKKSAEDREEDQFDFLPPYITYEFFSKMILGRLEENEITELAQEEKQMDIEYDKIKELEADKEMEEEKEDYDLRVTLKKMHHKYEQLKKSQLSVKPPKQKLT